MMLRKIKTFRKFDKENRMLIIKAFYLTGLFRFKILFTPFNKLAKEMGDLGVETTYEYDEKHHQYIKKVRRVVGLVGKNTPWESLCFVKALTAQKLLGDKSIDNTVYLGLAKDGVEGMTAHAWLRCGDKYITGYENMKKYSVVAKFGSIYDV